MAMNTAPGILAWVEPVDVVAASIAKVVSQMNMIGAKMDTFLNRFYALGF